MSDLLSVLQRSKRIVDTLTLAQGISYSVEDMLDLSQELSEEIARLENVIPNGEVCVKDLVSEGENFSCTCSACLGHGNTLE